MTPRIEYRIRWHDKFFRLDRVFEFGGRRYRCYSDDLAALRFLELLELERMAPAPTGPQAPQPPQMVTFRREFRRIVADQPIAGLLLSLVHGNEDTRRLALSLLGRCGNSKAIPAVRLFAQHPRRDIRLAAVQALRRLRARAELTAIAAHDNDPAIRHLAAAATRRSFDAHLARFLGDNPGAPQMTAPMPLVWNVTDLSPRPPKSHHLIRAVLERIRHLLRDNGASHSA